MYPAMNCILPKDCINSAVYEQPTLQSKYSVYEGHTASILPPYCRYPVVPSGGALSISSEVLHSKLMISSCYFTNNTAVKGVSESKGHGGGISIKSLSMEVEIKNSTFAENKANYYGLSLYTSEGVTVSLINCTFQYTVDPTKPIQDVIAYIAGMTTYIESYFQITNTRPEAFVGPINVINIAKGKVVDIETICPKWYGHNIQYATTSTVYAKRNAHLILNFFVASLGEGGQKCTWSIM